MLTTSEIRESIRQAYRQLVVEDEGMPMGWREGRERLIAGLALEYDVGEHVVRAAVGA